MKRFFMGGRVALQDAICHCYATYKTIRGQHCRIFFSAIFN
jgi:hypothetical protein